MLEQLKQAIASQRDEMAELTAALIAIDTENPPGRNYERCIRFLGERMDALGMENRIEPVPGGDADPVLPRFWLKVDLFQETRPAGVTYSDPTAKALREAITEVTGELAKFELCPGILETRLYVARGVPAFAYGPGLLTVAHGPREFVKRKDMEDVACVFALTATSMLAP